MATHKESKDCFFTPSAFADVIYDNFIFDVPKLLDLCSLYAQNNGALLSKMIGNIFTQQPKYFDDLRATLPTLIHIFISTAQTCGYSLSVGGGGGGASPQKLTNNTSRNNLLSMSCAEFKDIVLYVHDTASTLHSFLDVFPAAADVFLGQEFPLYLASFGETLTQAVGEAFRSIEWSDLNEKFELKQRWNKARCLLVTVFHQIVHGACVQPLLDASSSSKDAALELIESYMTLLTSVLGERRFVALYETLFPFADDRDVIEQSSAAGDVDDTRLQFIRDGLNEALSLFGKMKTTKMAATGAAGSDHSDEASSGDVTAGHAASSVDAPLTAAQLNAAMRDVPEPQPVVTDDDDLAGGACAQRRVVGGVELESLITAVNDLFPDFGDGFVERCLEAYDYSAEHVITAVLEDRLLPSLQKLDKSQERSAPPALPPQTLIEQRANIHDNDEFDIFRREDVDLSRVHKGKKTKVSAKDLEPPREDIAALRPLYERYGREFTSNSAYDDVNSDAYDDEYDDTYDTNMVGADDADSADELSSRRAFVVPRALQQLSSASRDAAAGELSDDSDDDAYETTKQQQQSTWKRRDEFVQNPAEIRAKREAARARNAPAGGRHYEVKGREKGQGQEKDVLRNRAFKEKNKNKQRRAQADRKRAV